MAKTLQKEILSAKAQNLEKNNNEAFANRIRKKTASIRRRAALRVMRCLTPKLVVEVTDSLAYVSRTPRPFTLHLKQEFGDKALIGVEIGFGFGFNAESLFEELNIEQLYCVDPFLMKRYFDGDTLDQQVKTFIDQDKTRFFDLKNNLRVVFVQLPSAEAFKELPRNLDFVYIDGNHGHHHVLTDLRNAFCHVKRGGIVGGHDFIRQCEVIPAVFDFALEIGQAPTIQMPDFWFKRKK
jgi:hypothetical protein